MKNSSITMRSDVRATRTMASGQAVIAFVQVPGSVRPRISFDADPQPDRGTFHA